MAGGARGGARSPLLRSMPPHTHTLRRDPPPPRELGGGDAQATQGVGFAGEGVFRTLTGAAKKDAGGVCVGGADQKHPWGWRERRPVPLRVCGCSEAAAALPIGNAVCGAGGCVGISRAGAHGGAP